MSRIVIPNVVIEVLTSTSRTFYEPNYVVPLLRAMWTGAVDDVYKDITVKEPKTPYQKAQAQRVFADSTLDEVCRFEEQRLRNLYGVNPVTKSLLFDIIYPGTMFAQAFKAVVGGSDSVSIELTPDGPVVSPTEVFTAVGISDSDAALLLGHGITTLEHLAACSIGDLLPIPTIGRVRGQNLIDIAAAAVHAPDDETPVPDAPTALDEE